ncbi:Protease prsW family protein [Streptomyces sp. SolWspMP-sol7th]|uniref:PrsW family glutamic-type intramembrane protease n=1 Tax=Streptomyces sp. SolWspMP-sol7th TaxID=1839776 RepID=UPI00081DA146|nr:PrsW family glutamic-type intramembrane protease [Streptomyces sp. SolWspMP-sol7th]SCE07079.1 Protease prsW family protein [Streptomyces sp. SolWspMP-sol7th]
MWSRTAGVDFASSWGAALTAPLNEEGIKTAGIVLLGVAFPARMRGPLDGWVLGALVGLGFQMAENWTYALNGIVGTGGTTPGDAALQSVVGRVLYTGLGSHWTMSAVAGTGCGPAAEPFAGARAAAARGGGGVRADGGGDALALQRAVPRRRARARASRRRSTSSSRAASGSSCGTPTGTVRGPSCVRRGSRRARTAC